jgi:hypothetical protein
MTERQISTAQIKQEILTGDVIEDYPTTSPYPSALLHGVVGGRAVHVPIGWDSSGSGTAYIVTGYEPDEAHFAPDRKTRKRRHDD